MAVLLLLFYPIAPAVIVGTDITHATVLSFVVGIAHMTQGNVDFALAGTLLLGGIPGVLVGSRLAPWIPGKPLKVILAMHADLRGYAFVVGVVAQVFSASATVTPLPGPRPDLLRLQWPPSARSVRASGEHGQVRIGSGSSPRPDSGQYLANRGRNSCPARFAIMMSQVSRRVAFGLR